MKTLSLFEWPLWRPVASGRGTATDAKSAATHTLRRLRRRRRSCSALLLSLSLSACAWAQPPSPKPHPEPRSPTAKIDRTAPPLTPVENVWALALNNSLTMAPAYAGSQAFFSIEGDRLVAYDLLTGKQTWMVTARPEMAPVAGGGLIFLRERDTIRALQITDGSVAWEVALAETLAVHPVWDNGWLVVALGSGEVRALRATDGQTIWSRDLKSAAHAPPALASDRVYIPTVDGRIVALTVEGGEPVWERRLGGAANEILALDDRLYAGSLDNFFYCVMTIDGRVDWRWRTGGDVIGKPVADERYVYFVALDNVLRAMNLVTGGQQWMRPLPVRPAWGPVMAGATIVVAGQPATLRAFNIKDGVAAGTLTGVAAPAESPAAEAAPAASTQSPPAKAATFVPLPPDAEAAASPYVLQHPVTRASLLLMVFRDIAKGAAITLVGHSFEPALVPAVAALPNLVQMAPVAPTTPPPRP